MILQSNCLVHYDPKLPIIVSANSSSYGIGGILAHLIDGKEWPVAFTSRTLTAAEKNYSQLEREALALVYALKKFHFYIYGFSFTLKTDHKPLLGLFSPDRMIPLMASERIIRWCLMMQAYKFTLVHSSGKLLGNVDALSRLPLPNNNENVPVPAEWVNLVDFLNSTPVTAKNISDWTALDSLLSKVLHFGLAGWPTYNKDPELQPYFSRRNELTLQSHCILWGVRIVIPPQGRSKLLQELHSEHIGICRMKQLARSYFWWPNIDVDIEQYVNNCSYCLEHRNSPPKAELHPWLWPQKVWHRVHADYAGPIKGFY